jgi:two-component system, NarL family, response regulator DevR
MLRATAAGPSSATRVLVVEDTKALGDHLAGAVARCIGEAVVVDRVRTAIERLPGSAGWTALILDLDLPDGSGIEVLSKARAMGCRAPALVLMGLLGQEATNQAFELRAGYLVKPVRAALIEQFVRDAQDYTGKSAPGPAALALDEDVSNGKAVQRVIQPSHQFERCARLSPRERHTVVLLLEGLADKEIATRLGISAHTVNQYTKSIYARLGVHSRAALCALFLEPVRRSLISGE